MQFSNLCLAVVFTCLNIDFAQAANVDEFGAPILDPTSQGNALYEKHCATCHNTGVARAPSRGMLGFLTTGVIYKTLTEGVMRAQAATLTDQDKQLVAEYLTRRKLASPDVARNPPTCTDAARAFDWSQAISGSNWGLTLGNTREMSEAAAGLTPADIPGLQLKWAFEFANTQRARSHPLIAGGAVFTGSQTGHVYALDAETGCVRWTFEAGAEVRTGIALAEVLGVNGQSQLSIYFGDLLGRVYAVDANTGTLVWRLRADEHPATTITGTPTVFEGRVYVPVSSLEVVSARDEKYECCKFRGSVLALDAGTGERIWQTYTIATAATPQQKNSVGTQNYGPSGAPIWNSPTIDRKRGMLYVGTGENYSSPASLTSDAILAFDLVTGELNWHYQATAQDAWNSACSGKVKGPNCPTEDGPDYDIGAAIVLTQDSQGKDVLLAPQKSGVVHAVDPDTGKLRWQAKVGRGGIHGGIHFGIAVSRGRAYIPISDAMDFRNHAEPANPGLFAINIDDGTSIWRAPMADECREREYCDPGIGAAITATSSLVFAGALDGNLRIHDAATGELLLKIDTTAPVVTVSGATTSGGSMDGGTAPLPFNGKLFVNSGYNFAGHMQGNVLLVYGKPEK